MIRSPNFLVRAAFASMLSSPGSTSSNIMVELTKGARAKTESVAKPLHLLGLTGNPSEVAEAVASSMAPIPRVRAREGAALAARARGWCAAAPRFKQLR